MSVRVAYSSSPSFSASSVSSTDSRNRQSSSSISMSMSTPRLTSASKSTSASSVASSAVGSAAETIESTNNLLNSPFFRGLLNNSRSTRSSAPAKKLQPLSEHSTGERSHPVYQPLLSNSLPVRRDPLAAQPHRVAAISNASTDLDRAISAYDHSDNKKKDTDIVKKNIELVQKAYETNQRVASDTSQWSVERLDRLPPNAPVGQYALTQNIDTLLNWFARIEALKHRLGQLPKRIQEEQQTEDVQRGLLKTLMRDATELLDYIYEHPKQITEPAKDAKPLYSDPNRKPLYGNLFIHYLIGLQQALEKLDRPTHLSKDDKSKIHALRTKKIPETIDQIQTILNNPDKRLHNRVVKSKITDPKERSANPPKTSWLYPFNEEWQEYGREHFEQLEQTRADGLRNSISRRFVG